jgi:hypothetical protein
VLRPAFGIGLALTAAAAGASARHMPAPLWRGVSRIVLICPANMNAAICEAVTRGARVRTALPVEPVAAALPNDRGAVILTIAFAEDGRSLVAIARRALEIDEAEGPAQYAVAWNAADPGAAVDDLLNRILPQRSGGGRRLE